MVVDTGPWIFGSTVMLPAGTIAGWTAPAGGPVVTSSKDEIKAAPKFDKDACQDPDYRDRVGEYYGSFRYSGRVSAPPGGAGRRPDDDRPRWRDRPTAVGALSTVDHHAVTASVDPRQRACPQMGAPAGR